MAGVQVLGNTSLKYLVLTCKKTTKHEFLSLRIFDEIKYLEELF